MSKTREIKFRAWDKEKNRMVSIGSVDFGHERFLIWEGGWAIGWDDNTEAHGGFDRIMQFTGLQDKNGRDIYEGDIVRRDGGDYASKVEWFDSIAGFGTGLSMDGDDFESYEVIGNVWENPELLAGK